MVVFHFINYNLQYLVMIGMKKRKRKKKEGTNGKLGLATVLLSTLFSCSGPISSASPTPPANTSGEEVNIPERPHFDCAEYESSLLPGESAIDVICREHSTYVYTGSSILIIPNAEPVEFGSSVTVAYNHSRLGLGSLPDIGIVDWNASEDTIFLLTKDRRIFLFPRTGFRHNSEVGIYTINKDVRGASLCFHSGFLFLGPVSDHLMAFIPSTFESRSIPLPEEMTDGEHSDFAIVRGRLYFGERDGKQLEIYDYNRSLESISVGLR